MDGESENLTALKRAYAEMILNTAREAASRFADADRRAARFHRELCFVRDDAVRMLVKLKRMLDAKTIEAETTVAKKEEQIEELEAQLEEAESKILDLRMELENVRDELEIEKAKNNPQSSAENKSSSDSDLSDRRINSLEPIVPYLSDSELNNAANQNNKERLTTDREMVQMSCNGIDPVGRLADPSPEEAVDQKTDLATMVIGRKEPELYRNRCTQRVRAFEGRLLQGTLGCELNSSACDKGENEVHAFTQSRNLEIAKMIPLQKLERPAIMREKKSKTSWAKKTKSSQIPVYSKQWRRQHLVSSLSPSQSYFTKNGVDVDKGFRTDQIESVHDADAQDGPLNLEKRRQSGDLDTIEGKTVKRNGRQKARKGKNLNDEFQFPNQSNITESSHFHLGQATPIEVKTKSKEFDNIGIINEENSVRSTGSGFFAKEGDELKEFPLSTKHKDDIAVNNVLVPYEESEPGSNSVNSDVDVERNVQEDGSCVQSEDNRLVKYTFQRKRKKAFSSNDSENKAPLGNTVKKHAGNLVKRRLEAKACKATNENSRDSRRLAQVARQLIALSGKRW
ncbi:hypothetical protein MLD38_022504 [Melastoma candidum]|uniref:Uncharacterized protein n=1 Tax=Melastoma candidum TaxID=119954 RepID=A0ACB9QJD5_9MYRT|nr:hypothetical protein MLD38_022504 [Melastoma candidum]